MSRWAVAAAALALLLASGAAAAGLTIADAPYTTKWPAVELSGSVGVLSFFELQPQNLNGKTVVPCQDAVDKAKELNMKSIQFAFTGYWRGAKPTEPSGWCLKNGYLRCEDVTAESIATLQAGMQSCVAYAVEAGFTSVAILPKIGYNEFYYWPNDLWFNPLQVGGAVMTDR